MAYWLIKEEPSHYAYEDLVRDRRTKWTGVHNALALQNLRRMTKGELALYYHTGSERACVGVVRIASAPRPDPADTRGSWWVEVRPVRRLERPIPLAELRTDPDLAGCDLLRLARLSVVPVADEHWSRILARERGPPEVRPSATGAGKGRARAGGKGRPRTGAQRRH